MSYAHMDHAGWVERTRRDSPETRAKKSAALRERWAKIKGEKNG